MKNKKVLEEEHKKKMLSLDEFLWSNMVFDNCVVEVQRKETEES